MEEGSMRADVNVSVRRPGDEFGTRTETKNVNSVRFVMAVIEGEAKRQVALIESGGRSEEHTSELQSLMRISYAVFCLKKTHIDLAETHTHHSNTRTRHPSTQLRK